LLLADGTLKVSRKGRPLSNTELRLRGLRAEAPGGFKTNGRQIIFESTLFGRRGGDVGGKKNSATEGTTGRIGRGGRCIRQKNFVNQKGQQVQQKGSCGKAWKRKDSKKKRRLRDGPEGKRDTNRLYVPKEPMGEEAKGRLLRF